MKTISLHFRSKAERKRVCRRWDDRYRRLLRSDAEYRAYLMGCIAPPNGRSGWAGMSVNEVVAHIMRERARPYREYLHQARVRERREKKLWTPTPAERRRARALARNVVTQALAR